MKMNIIDFMVHKYYNNIAKYIKLNLFKKVFIDTLIKNDSFHKHI